ncbi:MAG TPA: hypothetical protein VF194_13835 [Ferrovibrio sp.]|jgi:hypothetical protein|uniref:hypothetical protein n=1 Tax=Ferrovibrio sp. TaxID=1917215 RepID=UPI002ED0E7C2
MASQNRYQELAIVLPLGGTILFIPPYLSIFSRAEFVFGIPVMHLYVFGAWLAGILLTALLSRRFIRIAAAADPGPPESRGKTAIDAGNPPD